MLKSKKNTFLSILFIFVHFFSVSQNADSLLNTAKDDTSRVQAYNRLFLDYEFSDQEKAEYYLKNALELGQKINYKAGLAFTYYYMAFFSEDKGNYPEALKNYYTSLKLREEAGNFAGAADSYFGIGTIFYYQGKYDEALKKYTASLKIYEKIGNKASIATANNNIGGVYFHQHNYEKALDYYTAGLKMRKELGNERAVADSYGNIGNVYSDQQKYDESLEKYFSALEIMERTESKASAAGICSNIGIVYTKQKKYKEARVYLNKAKELALELDFKECLQNTYSGLSELDSATGDFKGAFENHRLYIAYHDSIDNQETRRKSIQSEMAYEFGKKEAIAAAEYKKELESQQVLQDEKSRKQKLIIIGSICGLLLLMIFAGFVFRSLRITRKQKDIIEIQKAQVESQKQAVERQKNIVEEKQKEIIDSITYARRIQRSLLPTEKYIDGQLKRLKDGGKGK